MREEKKQIQTISQQVYEILKDEICSGDYQPGVRLQEVEVAERLHVSRSPVREALHRLQGDGLVSEIPNKGVYVRNFSESDIENIFEVREAIENYAIMHLEGKLNTEKREGLKKMVREFQAYYDLDDLPSYIVVDQSFHNYLVECSGNLLLMELYEKVRLMNQRFRIFSLKTRQRFDESLVEHRSIVENILAGNYEEACRINSTHLGLAREKVIDYLKNPE